MHNPNLAQLKCKIPMRCFLYCNQKICGITLHLELFVHGTCSYRIVFTNAMPCQQASFAILTNN